METLTTEIDRAVNEDQLIGHVNGTVTGITPARTGDGMRVAFKLENGAEKVAYFAASGQMPEVGHKLKFSAWKQAAGNIQFRRETTTEQDLENLLV